MTTENQFAAAVKEVNLTLEREIPDPVGVFENDLAHELGLSASR